MHFATDFEGVFLEAAAKRRISVECILLHYSSASTLNLLGHVF